MICKQEGPYFLKIFEQFSGQGREGICIDFRQHKDLSTQFG